LAPCPQVTPLRGFPFPTLQWKSVPSPDNHLSGREGQHQESLGDWIGGGSWQEATALSFVELFLCNFGDPILIDIAVLQAFQITGLNTIEKLHFYNINYFLLLSHFFYIRNFIVIHNATSLLK